MIRGMKVEKAYGICSHGRQSFFVLLLAAAVLLFGWSGRTLAEAAAPDSLMPLVGGALVHAGEHKWQETAAELEKFETEWRKLNAPSGEAAGSVASALAEAKKAVTDAASKPDEAYQADQGGRRFRRSRSEKRVESGRETSGRRAASHLAADTDGHTA
ncbi:hypothetical protein [Paenibacillus oleatilyticus]|uniref:hypothetical protein n=1 Tax=Paenibacillus oleatilyticus TaxID=2594886 RepID=UPI001C1F7989|nr:hypothetical protein [Paenibacillus oleatilyticus]MBU7316850.1 hypothetical protein [Paenibacillus oleatilyticus]